MFEAKKLAKVYKTSHRTVHALKDISFKIEKGEFVAIVGPSGCGKSTLLMVLGGMLSPTSGELNVNDESIYQLSSDERALFRRDNFGFVFQSFHLLPYLTATQNVQMPLLLKELNEKDQKKRAEELLDQLGLGDRKDHTPNELSIGQQQRVALARTLANDPKIILADEPTGNLDPKRGIEIIDSFIQLKKEGRTIIMVTHNPEQAKKADRVLYLDEGLIKS